MAGHDSSARSLRLRLAEDLLHAECPGHGGRDGVVEAGFSVLAGLHEVLSPTVGSAGYEILLGRAAILAAHQHEGLGPLTTPHAEPPTREEIETALPDEPGAARRVAALLVCEILYYLARLVSWPLALSLLRTRWPAVVDGYPAGDFDDLSPPPRG